MIDALKFNSIASIFRNSLLVCLEIFNRPTIPGLSDAFRVPKQLLVSTAGFLISTKVAESSVRVVVHEEIAISRLFVTRYRHRSECHGKKPRRPHSSSNNNILLKFLFLGRYTCMRTCLYVKGPSIWLRTPTCGLRLRL